MVYEEFKFVSYDDLEALNATHLVGTKMLKKYSNALMNSNTQLLTNLLF